MRLNILLVILVVAVSQAYKRDECPMEFIDCYCETIIPPLMRYTVFQELRLNYNTGEVSCQPKIYVPAKCRMMNCTVIPTKTFLKLFQDTPEYKLDMADLLPLPPSPFPDGRYGFPPRPDYLRFSQVPEFPKKFAVLPEGLVEKFSNEIIETPCYLPHHTTNSVMKCYAQPDTVTCHVFCLHDYGIHYQNTTVQKMAFHCNFTEKVWEPQNLEDCRPFDNCTGIKKSPGYVKCFQPIDDEDPPYCEISCERHNRIPEKPLAKYRCGQKSYTPHCVDIKDLVDPLSSSHEVHRPAMIQKDAKSEPVLFEPVVFEAENMSSSEIEILISAYKEGRPISSRVPRSYMDMLMQYMEVEKLSNTSTVNLMSPTDKELERLDSRDER